ncbi:hypothetical protein F8R90_13005 [Nostoc sp. NZL]|nr:hypothetical protein [Nostoc sp. NZL]
MALSNPTFNHFKPTSCYSLTWGAVSTSFDRKRSLIFGLICLELNEPMLEFEDAYPQKFAQLVTDAPQWTEWMV